jgi:ribosome-binding factor A
LNSNKPYKRVDRLNKQILDILSNILIKNIDLSYLGFITFTSVDVAPDLRTAKVFYSILSGNLSDSKIEIEINKKQKAFKKFMSPQLSLRYTPDIRFILDESLAYSEKIDNLLKKNYKNPRSK